MDNFGPLFPFGFGLSGHSPLHTAGQFQVLHLHHTHLHTPGFGLIVDNHLQLAVDLIPLGQEIVQFALPHHRAQGGLGYLLGRHQIVDHIHHRGFRVQDTEVADRIDFDGHVVFGDGFLGGHVQRDHTGIHQHHPIDNRNQKEETRSSGTDHPAQTEDHPPLVFSHNADRRSQNPESDQNKDHIPRQISNQTFHRPPPLVWHSNTIQTFNFRP